MTDFDYNSLVSGNAGTVWKHRKYAPEDYFVTIRMTDFYGARVEVMENDEGEEEEYICIPRKSNDMLKTERNNILCTFRATVAERATNRYTHVLKQVLSDEITDKRKKLGFKIPLIGHMRPVGFKSDR